MPRRAIVVLGGNAFASGRGELTMAGQFEFARAALARMAPLFGSGAQVVLSHGNGPQVGHMLIRVEQSLGKAYALPLSVCVAESEGELGYVLSQTLHNVLVERGTPKPIATLVTQVEVDASDPAFARPDKPIGPFYSAEQAVELEAKGFVLREDAGGRGFRRVVASPEPRAIVDGAVVEAMLELGIVVVAAGGGGVPVVRKGDRLEGVDAVIDKDLAAALLGDTAQAELLVILTDVPCAYLDYRKPTQARIDRVTPERVRELLAMGHFPPGSMGPKMEAAARFASKAKRRAIVCDVDHLEEALEGRAGTIVEAT